MAETERAQYMSRGNWVGQMYGVLARNNGNHPRPDTASIVSPFKQRISDAIRSDCQFDFPESQRHMEAMNEIRRPMELNRTPMGMPSHTATAQLSALANTVVNVENWLKESLIPLEDNISFSTVLVLPHYLLFHRK